MTQATPRVETWTVDNEIQGQFEPIVRYLGASIFSRYSDSWTSSDQLHLTTFHTSDAPSLCEIGEWDQEGLLPPPPSCTPLTLIIHHHFHLHDHCLRGNLRARPGHSITSLLSRTTWLGIYITVTDNDLTHYHQPTTLGLINYNLIFPDFPCCRFLTYRENLTFFLVQALAPWKVLSLAVCSYEHAMLTLPSSSTT